MPRRPRRAPAGHPLHVVQRGNDRRACFFDDADRVVFLTMLAEAAIATGCVIHAYVLMDNHFHLLLTPSTDDGAARLMRLLGQRYVAFVNRHRGRSGTLWEGRFRSCLVDSEGYLVACYAYIDLNPVRAGMVANPRDWRWSSYRANAEGREDALATPHPVFAALGATPAARGEAYRTVIAARLAADVEAIALIRQATAGNGSIGVAAGSDPVVDEKEPPPGREGRPGGGG